MEKERFKTIKVDEAAGTVLMHDITRVVPGEFKGPAFKKGHIVTGEDIGKLKDLGKENLFVFDISDEEYHEDEAAELFRQFAGANVNASGPSEGKLQFISKVDGMSRINKEAVAKVNSVKGIAFATVHSNITLKKGEKFAGIRIIPLVLEKESVDNAVKMGGKEILNVCEFKPKRVGLIVTGSEVASGRIKDGFRPIIEKKVKDFNSNIDEFSIIGDEPQKLKEEIAKFKDKGCEFIVLTGGMSVDPDDITKDAIADAGVRIVSYGVPVLPGNMFMVGYLDDVPVFGVPACALFYERTVLDLFLPYVFSDVKINADDILGAGYGGFCRHCENCIFPNCGFGKC